MPPLHLIGFARFGCGCFVARYYQPAIRRNIEYVEEKGCRCPSREHRRDQPLVSRAPRRRDVLPATIPAT